MLTPHSAGGVLDPVEPMAVHAVNNMLRMLRGELPRPADIVVNPAQPRFTPTKVAPP